jgi:hypothetical protein
VGSVGIQAQDWLESFPSFSLTDANNSSTTFEHQEASHMQCLRPLLFNIATADDVRGLQGSAGYFNE